jgi:hypothetical protein
MLSRINGKLKDTVLKEEVKVVDSSRIYKEIKKQIKNLELKTLIEENDKCSDKLIKHFYEN